MDDKQLNRLNMYIKTADFLDDHSGDLTGVAQIADIKTAIDAGIEGIVDADGDADSDTTGFTIQKSEERTSVEQLSIKVSRAMAAYGLSIGNPGLVKLADYVPSEIESKRDNDLYVKCKKLWKRADPVKASLSNFNSGPTDVNNLSTALADYFDVIQLPEEKRGEKKVSGAKVDRLFGEVDGQIEQLDIYMATFAGVNEDLYALYLAARAIDESGGGSQNIKNGNAGINAVANVPFADGKITADTVLKLVNRNTTGELRFYFSDSATGGEGTASLHYIVNPETSLTIVAGTSGFDVTHVFLNLFNPNAFEGKWRVEIL